MKPFYTVMLISLGIYAQAQPDTEIYVFALIKNDSGYAIQNRVNITYQNPGYDNQPHFKPDGHLYYVSTKKGQTDVAEVELKEYSWSWLTATPGSEYSPTPLPGGSGFSAIYLEKDGTQLLRKYPSDFNDATVLVPDLKIGYHCWVDGHTLAAFVLGEPVTLQVIDLNTGKKATYAQNIGRSLLKIPGQGNISYISKATTPWEIRSLDPQTGKSQKLTNALPGAEDMCWAPDGTIFMGKDSLLYAYNAKVDDTWKKVPVIDNSIFKKDHKVLRGITRLSISPDSKKIAIVVNQ